MYRFGKICAYTIVSILISTLVYFGNGTFFLSFINDLIPLLATLFAIYLTANTLVTIEINRIKDKYPAADTLPTTKEIKRIFIIQLILILILIMVFVVRDFLLNIKIQIELINIHMIIMIISNAFAVSVFGYFLEAIYDTGKTLFLLIDFNSKGK